MDLRGLKYNWEVEGDTDAVALELTFSSEPTAKKMSFQKEYAEPLDWIITALKEMTFPFIKGE